VPRVAIRTIAFILSLSAGLFGCGGPERPPAVDPTGAQNSGSARQALPAAEAAASAWMRDARLIYLENDSPLDAGGAAAAWGFLFHSELADSWRNVAVRDGQVAHEGPLPFPFAGPELPAAWIDSNRAVEIAEDSGGREYRQRTGAALEHAVLGRGIFTGWSGPPTWTVVYRSPGESGELAIVVNAADGSLLSRFEG
jgi:hypothetical protein